MAPVQVKYVVSFTSQDDVYKANNLLCGDAHKKWLSHPKDRSGKIEIIFQLEEPCHFSYIDIGTVWCASLEIRVGRSDWPLTEEYKILVPTVSLMSPIDCQLGRKTSSTNMFSKSNFSEVAANQRWDRLQIICRQPYRKDVQLGISFVKIRNAEIAAKATPEGKCDMTKRSPLPSVSSIQKHFFGQAKDNEDDNAESLKYKLLQMANSSSENFSDVVHEQALSRTAQLVLKASEISQNSTKHYKVMGKQARRGLFSGSVVSKDQVKINEEISAFLPTLNIKLHHLDTLTVADIRHRFERHKKRKLSLEEKRLFSAECQNFLCDLVEGNTGKEPDKKITRLEPSFSSRLTPSKSESVVNERNILSNRASLTCGFLNRDSVSADRETVLSPSFKNKRTGVVNFSKNSPYTKFKSRQRISPAVDATSISVPKRAPEQKEIGNSVTKLNVNTSRNTFDRNHVMNNSNCDLNKSNSDVTTRKRPKRTGLVFKSNENHAVKERKTSIEERQKKDIIDISDDDGDIVSSESNISYDEDDEDIMDIISDDDTHSSGRKPPPPERGRTLQEVNTAYAKLYESNPIMQTECEDVRRRSWSQNRKQLNQSRESPEQLRLGEGSLTDWTGATSSSQPFKASMLICPTCDVLIPSETYYAHCSACTMSQTQVGVSASEVAIDKNEQFQECPICLERFQMDVLLVHASECGL